MFIILQQALFAQSWVFVRAEDVSSCNTENWNEMISCTVAVD